MYSGLIPIRVVYWQLNLYRFNHLELNVLASTGVTRALHFLQTDFYQFLVRLLKSSQLIRICAIDRLMDLQILLYQKTP